MADPDSHFDKEELLRNPFVKGINGDGQFIIDAEMCTPNEPPICYACNSYIDELYYDEFDRVEPKLVYWCQDGACYLVSGDMHNIQKNVEFNIEDNNVYLMNKIELLQSASKKKRKGLLSRLFKSRSRKKIIYGEEWIFVDPTKVNTIFNNRLPYCCMCGREIGNAYDDTGIYPEPGEDKATEIQAYVTGECYGNDYRGPHLVQTAQDCELEDMVHIPLRKEPLYAKKRRGGRK